MKLKRILSALVVFTLVMTSAVCSVNAAATYSASTTYTITEDGVSDVTIDASIAGATEGDMVSYILHEGDAVTEGSIVHIDQGTADTDGNVTFDAASYPKADVLGTTFKFTSSATGAVARGSGVASGWADQVHAVNTIDKYALGVNFISEGFKNTNNWYIFAIHQNGTVEEIAGPGNYGKNGFNGADAGYQKVANVPLDVESIAILIHKTQNRTAAQTISFKKVTGGFNGASHEAVSAQAVYSDVSGKVVDKLVGNVYKDTITDGEFAGISIEGGCVISVLAGDNSKDETAGSKTFMAVDSLPIMTKVTNDNDIECDSVTFLVSYTADAAGYTGGGVDVYRYSAAAGNPRVAGNSEGAEGVPFGSFDDLVNDGTGRFAIQLVDEKSTGELNPEDYFFVAIPYYFDAAGNKQELSAISGLNLYTQSRNEASGDGFDAKIEG